MNSAIGLVNAYGVKADMVGVGGR